MKKLRRLKSDLISDILKDISPEELKNTKEQMLKHDLMNKYYMPDISEFHIGFEFEHWNYEGKLISDHPSNKANWHNEICDSDWFNILLDDYEHDEEEFKKYRVKCLDQEDIESLGWKFIKRYPGSTYFFEKDGYFLDFDPEFGNKWNLRIYTGDSLEDEINYFSGYIKNKTEFKKILLQTNVLY